MERFSKTILILSLMLMPVAGAEGDGAGRHLFILSGQSNMRNPLPTAFEAAVGKVFGEDKVIVVTEARPSQPIRQWYHKWKLPEGMVEEVKGKNAKSTINGGLYDSLIAKVRKGIAGKKIESVTYIWMQGEADAGNGWGTEYEAAFYGILDQIKADLGVGAVNYVLGRINDYWTTSRGIVHGDLIRELQQKIGDTHDFGDWVDTDDLNTGINPWGGFQVCDGHFPPSAYSVLGERFARKASLLIDPNLKFGDEVFPSRHFDRPEEIAGHVAIDKKVSGSGPVEGDFSRLTDGKFGKVDTDDQAWLSFVSEGDEWTELVLDLGELRTVGEIGLNLLFHPEAGVPFPEKMTMEISSDGKGWQSLNRRNFNFKEDRPRGQGKIPKPEPRSLLALVPGPQNRGVPMEIRYFRVRIAAPKVLIGELIVDPVAR